MYKTNFRANVYNENNELIFQTRGEFYKRQSKLEVLYLSGQLPENKRVEVVTLKQSRKSA